jgi:hypothetical protein
MHESYLALSGLLYLVLRSPGSTSSSVSGGKLLLHAVKSLHVSFSPPTEVDRFVRLVRQEQWTYRLVHGSLFYSYGIWCSHCSDS